MKKYFYTILTFLCAYFTLEAHEIAPSESNRIHNEFVKESFTNFYEKYWNFLMEEFPEWATMAGHLKYNNRWQDGTPEAIERRSKKIESFALELYTIDRDSLSQKDQLNYDVLKWEIQNRIEGNSFHDELMPIDALNGIQTQIPQTLLFMPNETVEQAEDIFSRLKAIPEALEQVLVLLNLGIEKGITPPKVVMGVVPQQIENLLTEDPKESALYLPFLQLSENLPLEIREQFQQKAEAVIVDKVFPAFRKLNQFLIETYIPSCRETTGFSDLPDGDSWYRHKVKFHTSTNLTPEEIHAKGLQEIKRIRTEIDKIVIETGFQNYDDFIQYINTDKRFFFDKPEELLDGYRKILKAIEEKLPLLFGSLAKNSVEVVPVPAFSEASQIAAYYFPGSAEWSRPGYFFANCYKVESRPKWEMEVLALHEALPGHHLQISLAQEMKELPDFRKHFFVIAFVEGWALYSEGLGKDLDLYQDPYSRFGRLSYELFRAARLVVDTGLHYFGWTREQAIDYMISMSGMNEHEVTREVDRYLVFPGQALAYKIGEMKIREWRKHSEELLGEQFDVRAFHDELLSYGSSLTLGLLEDQMYKWMWLQRKSLKP